MYSRTLRAWRQGRSVFSLLQGIIQLKILLHVSISTTFAPVFSCPIGQFQLYIVVEPHGSS
jgi:hypothetical protein